MKLKNISEFTVVEPFYHHMKKAVYNQILKAEAGYVLWKCAFGKNSPPFYLVAKPNQVLPRGEARKCLYQLDFQEIYDLFENHGYPEDEALRKLCMQFGIGHRDRGSREMALDIMRTGNFFTITSPLSVEFLESLDPETVQQEIDLFLSEGCRKDPTVLFWAKSRLPQVSDSVKDFWIEKYRGHTLVIKNPKAGFSHLAQKAGLCAGYASAASVRGFSDAKGNICHGMYHQYFGSLTLDEVLHYKDLVSDIALTFMEQGRQSVLSGGVRIENVGAPAISLILNAGQDTATTRDMLEAVDKVLPQMTSVPEAFGSRFGLIVFSDRLNQVQQEEFLSQQEIEENEAVVQAMFEAATPVVQALYKTQAIQKWLNQPLTDYRRRVLRLCQEFSEQIMFGKRCQIFWKDHARGAFRHVRGVALEHALADSLAELLDVEAVEAVGGWHFRGNPNSTTSTELVNRVTARAEEALQDVIAINLHSLRQMVSSTESSSEVLNEMLVSQYQELKPGYLKAIVCALALAVGSGRVSPDQYATPVDLCYSYNQMKKEWLRDNIGKWYENFGRVMDALDKLKPSGRQASSRRLSMRFGIDLVYSVNQSAWTVRSTNSLLPLREHIRKSVEDVELQKLKKWHTQTPSTGSTPVRLGAGFGTQEDA